MAVNSISRNLNKSINLSKVLISSSSRYSIYKVQWSVLASLSLARTSIFYHNFKRLSRTFFKIFQSFSKPLTKLSVAIRSALAAAFRLYHAQIRLSRTFFVSFQTFSTATRSFRPAAQRSLFSLPHLPLFVKSFFRVFPNSQRPFQIRFRPVSCRSPFSRQPGYLSTSKPVCQDPFFGVFIRSLIPTPGRTPASIPTPPSRTACIY